MSPSDNPADDSAPHVHVPVLLREVLSGLQLQPGLTVVDGTVGAGGHSCQILNRIQPGGRLLGIDRDPMMLAHAQRSLDQTAGAASGSCALRLGSYIQMGEFLGELGWNKADRILLDLGLSSDQLADSERGFSFQSEGPLDLRFNPDLGVSAAEFLAEQPESEITRVLTEYGEEPGAARIARAIVAARKSTPLQTARDLAELITTALRTSGKPGHHPATRTFQALRIAVNEELQHVQQAVTDVLPGVLNSGGLAAVISFHSLEDRIVKQAFKDSNCWETVTSKPVTATPAEERFNPRSRSAKLRIARKKPV